MSVKINPKKIKGKWQEGFALDVHTTESTFAGYDAFGNPQFDTSRTPLGEALYRLKYKSDTKLIESVAATFVEFIREWNLSVDALVPVPPSNAARKCQPVIEIARAVSEKSCISLCDTCIRKVKQTQQLKNVFDYRERMSVLSDAFAVDKQRTSGKRLLVFDDLYRSGATLNAIAGMLLEDGHAQAVYALTLTRTRSKL